MGLGSRIKSWFSKPKKPDTAVGADRPTLPSGSSGGDAIKVVDSSKGVNLLQMLQQLVVLLVVVDQQQLLIVGVHLVEEVHQVVRFNKWRSWWI